MSFAQVLASADAAGVTVRRSWPRSPEHLLLDLDRDGQPLAGQWFADPGRAARTAARTGGGAIAVGGLVLQAGGADRRLPSLAELAAAPGARLVVHRAERRAVVRCADATWTKLVRPERFVRLLAATRVVPGVRTPQVLAADPGRGAVVTGQLPGRALHDVLRDGEPTEVALTAAAAGTVLARLHAGRVPADAPRHDAEAEVAVLRRWTSLAQAYGLPVPPCQQASVERLLAEPPGAVARLHRDLHDKQVLVDDEHVAGMLDLDLAAAGEPALDLANLLVHLELRALQGWCPPGTSATATAAVLEAYAPSASVLARIPAYATAAWLRLAAVYAFRPLSAPLLPALAQRALHAAAHP